MPRLFTRFRSSPGIPFQSASSAGSSYQHYDHNGQLTIHEETEDDEKSTTALFSGSTAASPQPPPAMLKVKRVDHYYSNWSKVWKYRNSGSNVNPESLLASLSGGGPQERNNADPWLSYCFVVVRKFPQHTEEGIDPTFQVVVKSPYLLLACKDVIGKVQGVSWTADPLELDPHLLLAFLPQFEKYRDDLLNKARTRRTQETNVMKTVDVLLEYLYRDYKGTIAKIANLTAHGEITFDTLFAIFLPRTIVVTECPSTGETRAFRIMAAQQSKEIAGAFSVTCESVDAFNDVDNGGSMGTYGAASFNPAAQSTGYDPMLSLSPRFPQIPPSNPEKDAQRASGKHYGRVEHRIYLPRFKGTAKIDTLDIYPLKYHPEAPTLEAALLARGKKWLELKGVHHMQYDGPAAYILSSVTGKTAIKYNVKSRVMIDRGSFRRFNPYYCMPNVKLDTSFSQNVPSDYPAHPPNRPNDVAATFHVRSRNPRDDSELTEEDLILTPPVLYGFSLTDKMWLEFNVQLVQPIIWNDEAFENLVLPNDRKILLQSLVEAHNSDMSFDDFVHNKGRGLVVNLFGPPGVGKTLSAEATSEHVRQPLYVVGAGDLGTTAAALDQALNKVFDIATSWKAIVLIDEADVFLEQRTLHDMERNAMVAVFLRHVEYYHGILFLTTNRVKVFDEAFLSRIHVALHFRDLTRDARRQVWAAFLAKVGVAPGEFGDAHLDRLAEREVNGRQIKNAVRTASSLAAKKGRKTGYVDLIETLNAMDEFTAEFAAIRRESTLQG
ncbi:P-loop containing nucleoside triphosphate hydrolase protein [Trametes polyzona]|nr:P-loop containing nucleoside triphosphate hydrolase protein [Trametes polyzona]